MPERKCDRNVHNGRFNIHIMFRLMVHVLVPINHLRFQFDVVLRIHIHVTFQFNVNRGGVAIMPRANNILRNIPIMYGL